MANPEITSGIKESNSTPSRRENFLLVTAFRNFTTTLHYDQRGEEETGAGAGCALAFVTAALLFTLLTMSAMNNEQNEKISIAEKRAAAAETAIAQIQTPTPTPTIITLGTPVR